MPTTIEDVARRAGVSTATVSRALRGLPNVAPSTREKIIRIAQELKYNIDPQISRLAAGRKVVALVAPLSDLWFYSKLSLTAEIKLITVGCEVIRYHVESSESQSKLFQQLTASHQVDGLIITSLNLAPEDVDVLANSSIPVVTVETVAEEFSSVSIDNMAAAELATRHLINLGHDRIGLIGGLDDDPWHFRAPHDRHEGYRRALSTYGIELRPEYEFNGNFSFQGGVEAMKHLFSVHQPPTAVFAISDEMAIGALKTINDLNLQVPADFSIIGFDDNDLSEYIGLTTIHQPVSEFGEVATSLLVELMSAADGQESEAEVQHIRLHTSLVVRATTGPAPRV